ncbi:MAG: alpha/beta fold hydrolase [Pirellulaceae bacterium]
MRFVHFSRPLRTIAPLAPRRSPRVIVAILLSLVLPAFHALAQSDVSGETAKKIPEPLDVSLPTKDGVRISCRFYPGTNGKKTVPIIIVHGWDETGAMYEPLALWLQKNYGHAVLVPDLRGHGESTNLVAPNGDVVELDRSRMNNADLVNMVRFDLEAVKRFLMEQNNKEELNIELLCVIGSEMGAVVGMNWVSLDWSWPPLPTFKQGQDVKAFVLISPPPSYHGMDIHAALDHPQVRKLSAMIVVGENDSAKAVASARRIHSALSPYHLTDPKDEEEKIKNQDLFFFRLDTSLQGSKAVNAPGLHVPERIGYFIKWRLVDREHIFPWTLRESPLKAQ